MNKRFTIKKDGFDKYVVSDKLNQFPMPIISLQGCECIEKAVNGLWEQTQRFEKYNQELIQRDIEYGEAIDELKKENEELKQENRALKECNAENSFMIDCFADEEVRLIIENEKLKKENKELKEKEEVMEKVLENMGLTVEYDNQEKIWRIE